MSSRVARKASLTPAAEYYGNALAGVETMPRWAASGGVTMSSGSLRLAYFTPATSFLTSTIISATTGTAAGATPTLCRMGFYTVAANGDLTLVAACANDTTLWAATNTEYARALTAPYTLAAGSRYAAAAICVTAAAVPTLMGTFIAASATLVRTPVIGRVFTGQADLPASVPVGSLTNNGNLIWVAGV